MDDGKKTKENPQLPTPTQFLLTNSKKSAQVFFVVVVVPFLPL